MKIVIACGAAIIKDKKLLLTKRISSKKNYPNCWTFPAGTLESFDKNLEATAIREVKEEVNLSFTPSRKFGFYETNKADEIIVSFIFLGEWFGEVKALESEVTEFSWFTYEEIKKLEMAFNYDEAIEDLYKNNLIE